MAQGSVPLLGCGFLGGVFLGFSGVGLVIGIDFCLGLRVFRRGLDSLGFVLWMLTIVLFLLIFQELNDRIQMVNTVP